MPIDIADQLSAIDALIRGGEVANAKKKLLKIPRKQVPRLKLATYCQLFRRLQVPIIPLQILNPIVRPSQGITVRAKPDEKIEYAIALIDVGSPEEALGILQTIDTTEAPRTLISQAFAHISLWNYRASLPLLNRYLEHNSLTHYERLVGTVNLLGALVHEKKRSMAEALIPDLLKETERKFGRLHGNVLLFAAENAVSEKDWKAGELYLERALKIFGGSDSFEEVFVEKWQAILEASQRKTNSAKNFEAVRKRALKVGHLETIRECDRMEAILNKDHDLFLKVYFGTPWEHYREWLCRDFKGDSTLPKEYLREMGEGITKLSERLDFFKDDQLREQPLLLRLFAILNRDFYQSLRIASIHTLLYPDEFFNPFSSPNRIHQLVDRLKVFLKEKKSPLKIAQDEGGYRLKATSSCKTVVHRSLPAIQKSQDLIQELRKYFPNETLFSSGEASEKLKMSSRTVGRFLQDSVAAGAVERIGKRRGTRYRLP